MLTLQLTLRHLLIIIKFIRLIKKSHLYCQKETLKINILVYDVIFGKNFMKGRPSVSTQYITLF